MGKQRRPAPEKSHNWRFLFRNSEEIREGGKKLPRLRSRFLEPHSHGGHGPPLPKSKKISYSTSKCHAVGLVSVPSERTKVDKEISSRGEEGLPRNSDGEEEDESNATYALINESLVSSPEGPTQPLLRPLYFEVPQEEEQHLVERGWLFDAMQNLFEEEKFVRGVAIHGDPGTGKTTIALQLVQASCFGRKVKTGCDQHVALAALSSKIVAYHFCQVDNRTTCLVPEFVHSIAAQMCQAPLLSPYREYLDDNPKIKDILSAKNCLKDAQVAFIRGIVEPLVHLRKCRKLVVVGYLILVLDSICEAESHRPGGRNGDTIALFLSKHILKIPAWLKIIITVRSNQIGLLDLIPFKSISLDTRDDNIEDDIRHYASHRFDKIAKSSKMPKKVDKNMLCGLRTHLLHLSGGCFLFLKLALDLLEQGYLVIKSSGHKGLPTSLQEVFLMHCNMRFRGPSRFNAVTPILSTCLVSLNPLNLLEIYHSVNSLRYKDNLPWVEFLRLFKVLQGLLIKRLDGTYMFFHSSFRDWLLGKDVGNPKFQCNAELGHAAITLRLLRVERPLTPFKILDLAHHLLKAKLLRAPSGPGTSKYFHAVLLLSSCENLSEALSSPANIYNTNTKVSRLLLLSGASPTASCSTLYDETMMVFHICAAIGNLELANLLIEFGVDINSQNDAGDTALHIASSHGKLEMVEYLLENGARVSQLNSKGETPIVKAAISENDFILRLFIDTEWDDPAVASVSKRDALLRALVTASSKGCLSSVETILTKCPYVCHSDTCGGQTPLVAACTSGDINVVKALLKHGASPDARDDEEGTPPLVHCVKAGYYSLMDLLISKGCDLDATDVFGKTSLHHSIIIGDLVAAEILINQGSDLNKRDQTGRTAMSWACGLGNSRMCRYLLQHAVNIQDTDNSGRSPLTLAACSTNEEIVQILLEANAPIEQSDFQGSRPLDYAVEYSTPDIVKLFLHKGAKINPSVWRKAAKSPLMLVVLLGKVLEDGIFLLEGGQISEAENRLEFGLRKLRVDLEDADGYVSVESRDLQCQFLMQMLECQRQKKDFTRGIKIIEEINSICPNYQALHEYLQSEVGEKLRESLHFQVT